MLDTSSISKSISRPRLSKESIAGSLCQIISVDLTKVNSKRQQVIGIIIRCRNTCAAINQCSNTIINSFVSEVEVGSSFCQSISIVVSDRTHLCHEVSQGTSNSQVTLNFKVSGRTEVSNRQSVLIRIVSEVGRVNSHLTVSSNSRDECGIEGSVSSCGVSDVCKIRLVSSTSQITSNVTSDLSCNTQCATDSCVRGYIQSIGSRQSSSGNVTSRGLHGDLVSA